MKQLLFFANLYPLDKDLSAKWFIEHADLKGGGKQKKYINSKIFPTLQARCAEAERIIADLKSKWKPIQNCFHQDLLRDLYEVAEMRCIGKKKKTRDTYMDYYNGFLKWYIKEGATADQNKVGYLFQKYLMQNGKENATHNNYRRNLTSFFKDLISFYPEKYFTNPFDHVRKLPERSQTKKWFQPSDQKRLKELIAEPDPQLWLGCLILVYCFIRPKEMIDLRLNNINFDTRKFQIDSTVSKNNYIDYVPIPEQLFKRLLPFQQLPGHWYLFGNGNCPGPFKIGMNALSRRHKKNTDYLNMPADYTFYSWKNTGAVELVKNGTHMKVISMLMRHASIETTDIYLKSLGIDDLISQVMIKYSDI
jgi:integrase